jgi:membrane protein implicated in regulation of membrane protease activity
MVPWMIWVGIGIICVIIEIFTPGFLFMSFGVGAIITGLLVWMTNVSVPVQILIFAVITFVVFLLTRKLSKKLISAESEPTNVDALKGKQGSVVKEIPVDGRGYVKVGGEEWSAISQNNLKIKIGKKVTVQKIEGNKLIVLEIEKEKEEE